MNQERRVQYTLLPQREIFTPAVSGICILLLVLYISALFVPWSVTHLSLSRQALAAGKIWTLVTYSFLNLNPFFLVMNCVVVLFLGSAIEGQWRSIQFLILWVVVAVVSGLIWIGAMFITGNDIVASGSGVCAYGLIGAYGLLFRHNLAYNLFGSLKPHHSALLLIAIGIVLSLSQPITLIWVGGAAVAYGYCKLRWWLGRQTAAGQPARVARKRPGAFVDVD